MNLTKFFQLEKHNTTYKMEILAGFTTFFTMSYIIFANPVILSETGMSYGGLFSATIIVSAICTLLMALFANSPFAMAPGMGVNTFVAYIMCIGLNFHWKEAMAITFITGIVHFILVLTGLRKEIVKAIPNNLKYATAAGIGFLIVYIGLKNAGLLNFILSPNQYIMGTSGTVIGNSKTVPSFISAFSVESCLSVLGLFLITALLAMEKKYKESYGSFLLGIIIITFIGIPFGVTKISFTNLFDMSFLFDLKEVAFSFFGNPGLLSVFSDPIKILTSVIMINILLLTNVVDGFSSIISIGQASDPPIFDKEDMDRFESSKGISSRLDKSLVVNSAGGVISALSGTIAATTYVESITGVTMGGKTGLTSLVVAALFLLCLPFSNFFEIIPNAATAPVLIIAGICFITLLKHVNWGNFEESVPCALTLSFIPLTFNILDGVAVGYIAYVVISAIFGKLNKVHPIIYVIVVLFIAMFILRTLFKI